MLGTDFEVFLMQGAAPVNAGCLGLPGKSDTPIPLSTGAVHRDNVMLELTVPPAVDADEFIRNIAATRDACAEWVRAQRPEFSLGDKAGAVFMEDTLCTPEGMELGCDIDYIAKDNDSVARDPLCASDLGFARYAGGHVHISYETAHIVPPWMAAMLCDLVIGVPVSRVLNQHRARFYGLPTLHRPTMYPDGTSGVEYRVLDNFWTAHEPFNRLVAAAAERVENILNLNERDLLIALHRLHRENINLNNPLACLRNDEREIIVGLVEDTLREYNV